MFSKVKRWVATLMVLALVITSINIAPITVSAASKKDVQKVEITKPDSTVLVLKKGKTYKLSAVVTPKTANKALTYQSSKKAVATVSSKGIIKAKKNGKAKITVASKQKKSKKDTIQVIVGTPVTKVALNNTSATLKVDETLALSATLSPKKPSYKKVKWTSSDEGVATVSSSGVVTAKAAGSATITVKADDGSNKKAVCTVTVESKPADTIVTPDPNPTPNPTPDPNPTPNPTPDPNPTPNPEPEKATLKTLTIKTEPETKDYFVGDVVDTTGLAVEAGYSDGTKKEIELKKCTLGILKEDKDAEVEPITTALELTHKYIVVSYTEADVTATAKQEIKVETKITNITEVSVSKAAVSVENGTTEDAVIEELAKLTITGNDDIEIENAKDVWTIADYAAATAGEYTATLDVEKLTLPENCVLAEDVTAPTVTVTVKAIPITKIAASAKSVTVAGGTTENAIKVELAKLTLTANEDVTLENAADLWKVANYDVAKPGKTYTATLDKTKLKVPENYELEKNLADVTVSVVVEKIEITSITKSAEKVEVAFTATKANVLEKLAALTLTGNENIALENSTDAWTVNNWQDNTAGTYTATLDTSKLTLPEGYKWSESLADVTVTVESKTIKITTVAVSKTAIDVDLGTTEEDAKAELAKLTFVGNTDIALSVKDDASWTIEGYKADEAGTYTATFSTSDLTIPNGYELAEDINATINVSVNVVKVTGIEVTTQPTKTTYIQDSVFDKTGMVVTATYSNGKTKVVTENIVVPTDELSLGTNNITISYTENGVRVTTTVDIEVISYADSLKNSITAHYSFDDTLVNDKSENGTASMEKYHRGGTSDTAPVYVEGVKGKAVNVTGDGTHDGVKLDATITSEDYTISMWIKPGTQTGAYPAAFYAMNGADHYLAWYSNQADHNNGFIGMNFGGRKDTGSVTNMYKTDRWTMVTYTMNGAEGKVYLDGKLVESATQAAGFFTYANDIALYLGTGGIYDPSFIGSYDEVSIFNEALSAGQVSALYDGIERGVTRVEASESKIIVSSLTTEDEIKAKLAALTISASMNTDAVENPTITNDINWTLTETKTGYTATKDVTLPEGYAYVTDAVKTVTVNVVVSDADPETVTVKAAPKTRYYVGETFDATGMVLTITYTDGVEKDITEGYTVDLTDPLTAEKKEVTITYTELVGAEKKEVTITGKLPINVYEKQVVTYSFDDTLNSNVEGTSAVAYAKELKDGSALITTYAAGIEGKALSIDPSFGYGLGTIPAGCGSATISFWINSSSNGYWNPVTTITPNRFNTGGENWVGLAAGSSGAIKGNGSLGRIGGGTDGITNSPKPLSGKWEYVTIVIDGSTKGSVDNSVSLTMYLNGELWATADVQNNVITDTSEVFIGVNIWGDDGITGLIDEYKYANYAFSSKEAKDAYAATTKKIVSVAAGKTEIAAVSGTSETDVKEALAEITLTGTTANGDTVEITNSAELWTIENYQASVSGTYKASLNLTAVEGYTLATDLVTPEVQVAVVDTLESISITTPPTKTVYVETEVFDKTGMVVKANYAGGITVDITADVTVPTEALVAGTTSIDVTYQKGEDKFTDSQIISVKTVLEARTASYAFDEALTNGVGEGTATLADTKTLEANTNEAVYEDGVKGKGIVTGTETTGDIVKLDATVSGSAFTINLWVQPKNLDRMFAPVLFGTESKQYTRQIAIYTCAAGVAADIRTFKGDGEKDIQDVLSVGRWTMLTWVNSEGNVKLYADGVEIMDSTSTVSTISNIFIGGSWWDSAFNGIIDEVSIYDGITLNADAVKKLYNSVKPAVTEITSIKSSSETLTLDEGVSEEDVKAELAKLILTGNEDVALTNVVSAWEIADFTGTAGNYTATLNASALAIPDGYALADSLAPVTVTVTINSTETE